MKYFCLLLVVILGYSCRARQETKHSVPNATAEKTDTIPYGAGDIVTKGYVDSKSNVWFTTSNEGVYRYDGEEFIHITEKDGLCSNEVSSVVEDKNGMLWFATAKGLCKYDGRSFVTIPLPKEDTSRVSPETGFPSRTTENILNIMIDRKGNFWLGTDASGAYRYDGTTFTSYLRFAGRLQPDSMYNNCITSILEDEAGNIWFTSMTHGAINRLNGDVMTHFTTEDGLLGDMITSAFQDGRGHIWFGSIQNLNGGISRWDGKRFTHFTTRDGLSDSNVVCFYEDESGRIWIGTGNGVCYYEGTTFTRFDNQGQSLGDIRFIVQDAAGHLWFGGRYGVLWRFDGQSLDDYTHKKK